MSVRTSTVGPAPLLQDADDAVAPHVLGYLEAERAQARGHLRGGLHLLEGELGLAVQIQVEGVE